ncbi:ABC transporter permease [Bacillus sp. ISL-40]|nr:ABC transporter permease [Bacillus sp. ISL-40]MBT2739767.1 ABC transporter permease [Bacillus sp. ISL-77]
MFKRGAAQNIIPISGMVIGNSMVRAILFLNRFTSEVEAHQDETELILSLGGTPKQAIHTQLITSIKASMIPTIESQKIIRLVQLPRMMSTKTSQEPTLCRQSNYLSYPSLFNQRMQLLRGK